MLKFKVAVLTSAHTAKDIRIFHKQCVSLAKAGYDVNLIVPSTEAGWHDGVKILPVERYSSRLKRMTLTVWRIFSLAVKLKADIYHFHDPELIPIGLLLRAMGKKVIYDVHEDAPATVLSKQYLWKPLRQPISKCLHWLESTAVRRFSAVIPVTLKIAERFKHHPHCVVVRNYPMPHEFTMSDDVDWGTRQNSAAYVGGISEARGIRQMVEAITCLPQEFLGQFKVLELAGGFLSTTLRDEIIKLPGWSYANEHGVVGRAEVAHILANARVGLVVLHPTPNHLHSLPIKLFEYMSSGIPVVASDFPLWREIIEAAGCGILVDPFDTQAIASAMQYLFEHPAEAEKMGQQGRDAVRSHYNWGQQEAQLLKLYSDLLQGKK
ncbi:MAG TPA: glycosyltransferase family 4 protein [Abditibacteriaceae bacterium]|jgi:hypothetical protein